MGKPQVNEWAVIPPTMLISVAEASVGIPELLSGHYISGFIAAGMSFVWFHIALMCMKYGVQPWRVVPALAMASALFGLRAVELVVAGHLVPAIFPVLGSIVWGIVARKSNQARKAIEAETNAR